MSPPSSSDRTKRPKLYVGTACDQCFRCKARCAGEKPICARCKLAQSPCTYSTGNRTGRGSIKSDRKTSTTASCASSTESVTASTQDGSHESSPDRRLSFSDAFVLDHDLALWPSIGTAANTTSHIQPSTEIDDFLSPYATTQSTLLAPPSNLFSPSETPSITSDPCHKPDAVPIINEYLWFSSSPPYIEDPVKFTPTGNPHLPNVISGNGAFLQKSLARLHAYHVGVSQDSPQETLLCLQDSLAIIGECVSHINTVGIDTQPSSIAITDASCPSQSAQLAPTVAMLCIHTIHLIIVCYIKLREGGSRASDGYKDLLDAYIIRDMQRCQSVAEKLDLWCRKLVFSSQHSHSRQQHEASAILGIMVESVRALYSDGAVSAIDPRSNMI